MAVFLVTWNLNKEGAAYNVARQRILDRLDGYENSYDGQRLDTVCFISTGVDVVTIYNALRQAIDSNDSLVVTRIRQGEFLGWLGTEMAAWIDERIR